MPLLALVAGYVVVGITGFIGVLIAYRMFKGHIDLRYLVSEKDGPASLSRFQFLLFTFVVVMCLVVLTLEGGEFPKVGADILGLLGISSGSYVISKGIQQSGKNDSAANADTSPTKGTTWRDQ